MAQYRIHDRMYNVPDYETYERLIYEPGRVARIKLNRPRYRNALSHPLLSEIEHAFGRAMIDPEVKVIVLSGEGVCFSAGDDAFGLTPESAPMLADGTTPEQMMQQYGSEGELWRQFQEEHFYLLHGQHGRLRAIPKPTIAMVHGWCIFNAFNTAASMDLIFASEDALFVPANAAIWEFGPRKALEIAYEHRFLTARECKEIGMVSRIYPDFATLERETLAYAERVADNPATRNRSAKEYVQHVQDIQGWTQAYNDTLMMGLAHGGGPSLPVRTVPKEDLHRERYEGRGMARTPKALANLKAKLESQGEPVPQHVLDALKRATERDDRGAWQRALTQSWRDPNHIERAKEHERIYQEKVEAERKKALEESKS